MFRFANVVGPRVRKKGRTVISRVYHIDRGYEAVERKLARVGARVERLK